MSTVGNPWPHSVSVCRWSRCHCGGNFNWACLGTHSIHIWPHFELGQPMEVQSGARKKLNFVHWAQLPQMSSWRRGCCNCRLVTRWSGTAQTLVFWAYTYFNHLIHFQQHIAIKRAQAQPKLCQLGVLAGIRWGSDWQTLRSLYLGHIWSSLEYTGGVWMPSLGPSGWEKLEKVQNQAVCIITGCMHLKPKDALLIETNLVPLSVFSVWWITCRLSLWEGVANATGTLEPQSGLNSNSAMAEVDEILALVHCGCE